jgi:NAD(P)-dependent dehydrogenase (short-subunit alcohol dehydrogenase family)
MGMDFALAAFAAGDNVVATARDPEAVRNALGDSERLLVVALDVTSEQTPARRSRRPSTASARSTCSSSHPPSPSPASSRS